MPWFIEKRETQYCVFKENEVEPLQCYDSEMEALDYLRALYANEKSVKFEGHGKIGGYGVRFSDSQSRDLQGDYFTLDTNLWLEYYPRIPVLYQHGQDDILGKRVIGVATPRQRDESGVWYETQLTLRDEYENLILELVKAGALGYSTGSLPHLVERASDGKLISWPVVELTLTPTPAAGPYLTAVQEVRSAYKAAAIQNPQILISKGVESMSGEVTSEAVENMIGAAIKDIPDAAKIKELIDETLRPYLQPQSQATHMQMDGAKSVEAFKAYLHTGSAGGASKAMQVGTPGEGGYLVPEQYYAELVRGLTDQSILRRSGARIIPMTSDKMEVPTLTHAVAAVLTSEELDYDEADPTIGHVTFLPYKFTRLTKVSEELAADAAFDIWSAVLAPDFAQAFAAAENIYFTTGSGDDQPEGVVTGAGVGKTTASSTAITADEVIDLYYSLGYLYRQNAVWMMHDTLAAKVRKLVGGDGQYLWQAGLQAGQPDTLLGRPVITNNNMPVLAAGAKVMLFGNFSYYWIGQRAGMTVDRNPYLYMENGQIGFFARMRVDGHVVLADAFKVLQMKA